MSVDPKELKKLKVLKLLVSFALQRRLSYAQLNDLVERALTEKLFDLDAATHEFALFTDQTEATYWAEALERSGKAAHLFGTDVSGTDKPQETFGGYSVADFQQLPAEKRLEIINRVEHDRAEHA
jgi:hypothetical protein